ncbi:MAG: glycosyltransferase family 39 protein [Lentisphaeria bacterium]|nr:glycosyltransferase family 39 protein [Lentisphaeria bacterium]
MPSDQAPAGPIFSRRGFLYLLGMLVLLRLLLNCMVPLMDPSEARYALICKIMAESGNYLEPKLIHDGVLMNFEGKPPLSFQAGAVACSIFGANLFAVRLPSFLFAAGLLAVLYGAVRRIKGENVAQLAVLLTLSSPVFFLYAGMCMTDMALAFCVCSAVFAYMLFDHESARPGKKLASIGFFAALGLGMLVKGPVALVMAGMPVFLFVLLGNRWRDLKNHAWLLGTAAFVLIAAPWYVLMQRANPDFLYYFFVNENFKRFLFKEYGDQYGAGRETFRGMALVWFLLSNLPAILLILFPACSQEGRRKLAGLWRKKALADDLPLLGVLAITLFWCLTSRVLITYVLPTVPFFSVWLANSLTEWDFAGRERFRHVLRAGLPLIWCIVGAVFSLLWIAGDRWVDKMPGDFFRDAGKLIQNGEFYFYRRVPYSAYFYFGDRTIPHADEDAPTSEAASQGYFLVSRKRDIRRHPLKYPRRLLLETGVWALYAPVEGTGNAGTAAEPPTE